MPKGHTNNPNGRPKGSKNKNTQAIRDAYQVFIENNMGNFEKWIAEVAKSNPAKAMELVAGLSDYVLPRLQRTELKGDIKTTNIPISEWAKEDKTKKTSDDKEDKNG